MENKHNKKPFNKWLTLISIPIQMGVVIFLFSYLGTYLDDNYPNTTFNYQQVFFFFLIAVSLYNVIKQVNNINK